MFGLPHNMTCVDAQVIGCRGTVEVNPRLMMGKELQVMGVMLAGASAVSVLVITMTFGPYNFTDLG